MTAPGVINFIEIKRPAKDPKDPDTNLGFFLDLFWDFFLEIFLLLFWDFFLEFFEDIFLDYGYHREPDLILMKLSRKVPEYNVESSEEKSLKKVWNLFGSMEWKVYLCHRVKQYINIMKKIYLVECEYVLDYELNRSIKSAFTSKLKAMLEFEAQREAIKKEFAGEDGVESKETDGCYDIYLVGCFYEQTHGRVSINEIPLND